MTFAFQWIRNLPVGAYDRVLRHYASRLGRPFSYTGERKGALIHDIRPSRDARWWNTSSGSSSLGLHTEMAFHHLRPKYVLLFCVRNRFTRTHIACSSSVLSATSPSDMIMLKKPFFQIHPPRSFTETYISRWRPLVDGHSLCVASHCDMTFIDHKSQECHQRLIETAQKKTQSVVLRPGDLLILNNESVLHGRENVHPEDVTDRLLYRMYVI